MSNNEQELTNTDNKKFPCRSCGGFLIFEPGQDSLKCPYCGELNEIEKKENIEVIEEDFEKMISDAGINNDTSITVHQIKCESCGAVSKLPENVTSANCPFCGTAVVLANESIKRIIKPKFLIPFKLNKRAGQDSFAKWVKGLWFTPSALKNMAQIDSINGVYTPYWTYDAQTETDYTGEKGTRYTVSVQRNGKTETETKTRWDWCSGHVSHFFDDVLVTASKSLPEKLAKKLKNWNYTELVPYTEEYVSGFTTEIYQIDIKQGFEEAKQNMNDQIRTFVKNDIGGDEQRINKLNTAFNKITFKHILLPVWISSYRYKNKTYNFLINGQDGSISGNYPLSFWKIFFTVLGSLILIGGALWIGGAFK